MSRSGAPPQADVTKSLWSTVPASTKAISPGARDAGRAVLHRQSRLLKLRFDRQIAVARRGRIGADEEGAAAGPLDPARELVALAIERVEQHHAAHPAGVAADRQRIGRRQIAAAVGDDDHRHAAEGAMGLGVEVAELALGLVEEAREAAGRPEPSRARIGRVMGELRNDEHRVEAGIGELPDDLLAGDHVALERRVVAVEEHDDVAGPARVEICRRGQEDRPVVVGLVLPRRPPRGLEWPSRPLSSTSRNGRVLPVS